MTLHCDHAALLAGHHGQVPERPGLTTSSLHSKTHQQQLEAKVADAGHKAREVALDNMDQHGGWGTKMVAGIEDAINTPPTDDNSHYFSGHTDRMTHLTLITFIVLATLTVACMWRENQTREQSAPPPQQAGSGGGAKRPRGLNY